MIKNTLLIFSLLFSLNNFAQIINAVTETGETVILYKDKTWKYVNDSIIEVKEIPTNNYKYIKPDESSFMVKSNKMPIGFWLNPKKWSFKKSVSNEAAEFTFTLKNSDLYAMAITERTKIPLENLKKIAIDNAKEVAPDVTVEKEEFRTINGKKVLMMQLGGTTQGIKFKYFAYYFSGEIGVVQFVTYCSDNLFEDYKKDMETFLNGIVVLN